MIESLDWKGRDCERENSYWSEEQRILNAVTHEKWTIGEWRTELGDGRKELVLSVNGEQEGEDWEKRNIGSLATDA